MTQYMMLPGTGNACDKVKMMMENFPVKEMFRNCIFEQPVFTHLHSLLLTRIISTIRNWFENFLYFETVLAAGTVVFEEKTVDYQKTVVVVVEQVEQRVCVYFCSETLAVF